MSYGTAPARGLRVGNDPTPMDKPVKHPRRRFAAARRLLRLALSPADWPAAWREAWELVRRYPEEFGPGGSICLTKNVVAFIKRILGV